MRKSIVAGSLCGAPGGKEAAKGDRPPRRRAIAGGYAAGRGGRPTHANTRVLQSARSRLMGGQAPSLVQLAPRRASASPRQVRVRASLTRPCASLADAGRRPLADAGPRRTDARRVRRIGVWTPSATHKRRIRRIYVETESVAPLGSQDAQSTRAPGHPERAQEEASQSGVVR